MDRDTYGIILCGGKGERLWPYSRVSKPKQFLSMDNGKTLIENTLNRSKLFSHKTWVVSGISSGDLLKQSLKNT